MGEELKESLKKLEKNAEINNEHIHDKYKDMNLTEEIEKDYEHYEEDKGSDYYKDVDSVNEEEADEITEEAEEEPEKPEKQKKKSKKEKKKEKKQAEEEAYNTEWDEKVAKLHAHDLLTFRIKKKDYETFFEPVEKVPLTITC